MKEERLSLCLSVHLLKAIALLVNSITDSSCGRSVCKLAGGRDPYGSERERERESLYREMVRPVVYNRLNGA